MELTRLAVPARLEAASIEGLLAALSEARGAVVLQGATAGEFCSGMELRESVPPEQGTERALRRFAELLDALQGHAQPLLALIDGPALGGGLGIAAAADLVLCSERAAFGLPEVVLGLVPGLVLPVIARRTGLAKARLLALGEPALPAREAAAIGLADEVCADLEESLRARMRRLSRMEPAALAAAKALSLELDSPGYRDHAIALFCQHLAAPGTRLRLARHLEGLAPWEDQ